MLGIMILGPTGIGKTEISFEIAKRLNLEIISADSMQLYKYMDIGTAKIEKKFRDQIKHFMLNVTTPDKYYNVGKYCQKVCEILNEFEKKDKTFVVSGGTGLYLKAIDEGLADLPKLDMKLRNELETFSLEQLQQKLKIIDLKSFENIEIKNKRRVIRALEVFLQTQKSFVDISRKNIKNHNFSFLKFGLYDTKENMYENINKRVDKMINLGLVKEAEFLYKNYKKDLQKLNTIGYNEIFKYFEGEIDLKEAIVEIKKNSRHYAKRQMTWFKKIQDVEWFNLEKISKNEVCKNIIDIFVKKTQETL